MSNMWQKIKLEMSLLLVACVPLPTGSESVAYFQMWSNVVKNKKNQVKIEILKQKLVWK